MRASEPLARLGRVTVVALAGFSVLGAPSEAEAVFDCLPPPNCRAVKTCCKKTRIEFWLQVARAELRRDFYNSEKNRQEAFDKGAWDSPHHLEKAFGQFISTTQDAAAKQRLKIKSGRQFDDVADLTTDKDCKTWVNKTDKNPGTQVQVTDLPKLFDDPKNPLNQGEVCKEAIAAAVWHESEHQDRCEADRKGLIKPKAGVGPARRELDESADKERDGYAEEAAMLRMYWRQARKRCTTAKALADDDFKNAKQKVEALNVMRQPRTW